MTAVSIASVPLFVKKDLESRPGAISAMCLATFTWFSVT